MKYTEEQKKIVESVKQTYNDTLNKGIVVNAFAGTGKTTTMIEVAKTLKQLGAKNIIVSGNIKSVVEYKITKHYQKPKEELIVAGSTHKGEEELILNSFKNIKNAKLLIVPRHPERFKEVDKIIEKFAIQNNFSYGKIENGFKNDIILVDKIGELLNLYSVADKVVLGGSFVDNVGGHNPLEVAYFKKPLISGKYIFNQKALFEMVENSFIIENSE